MDGGDFTFHDLAPSEDSFRDAVLAGLGQEPKTLPCKFFYDVRGSALFEQICEVPEYYLTRTEIAILDGYAGAIAAQLGAHCRLVELGSGSSRKVRILLEAAEAPAAYVPVDISREYLREAAARLAADFQELRVVAVCADYTRSFPLPPLPGPPGKRVGFFPGSTIGNFEPEAVVRFLAHCAELLGPDGEMLIGVDLKKDPPFSTPPTTTGPGSTPPSTSTCWSGSTASSAATSMSTVSSIWPSTMPKKAGWSFISRASPTRPRPSPDAAFVSPRAS